MGRVRGAAIAAALLGALTMASAAHASTYLDLGVSDTGQMYEINDRTGMVTLLTGANDPFVGLGEVGGVFYGETNDELYRITVSGTTVTETAVGGVQAGVNFVDFGSTTGGLFALGSNGDLYSISASGAVLDKGATGLGSLAGDRSTSKKGVTVLGMSTGSSTLYVVLNSTVYSIDTVHGTASAVGTITNASGKKANPGTDWGALIFESNTLYGGANNDGTGSHGALYTFSPSYLANFIHDSTPNPGNRSPFWGLVQFQLIPEPSEWALMLVGVGAVGGALRARRRKATVEA